MKKIITPVYVCEHCKRKMLSAGAMGLHEKQCKENPKNKHKCLQWCRHLERSFNNNENSTRLNTKFSCKLQPLLDLYSYKLERFSCHSDIIKSLTRMPLECNLYEDGQYEPVKDISFDDFDF